MTDYSDLLDLLRIESVSADPARASDVRAALDWVVEFVRAGGGEAELVPGATGDLVAGEFPASRGRDEAPTVLVYGHVDVQPPDPLDAWESPPFEPVVRDGWLHARGVADDKGQLWLLLEAARALAARRELPVNVRILCDGEEEIGGSSAEGWIDDDRRGADACVIFDTAMLGRRLPVFSLACRGTAYFHVAVRTGERDVHSGVFGGAALNALHVLTEILQSVQPRDGQLPHELCAGVRPPDGEDVASWADLPQGEDVLAGEGVSPADPAATRDFYVRTWAQPSLDVHGIAGGSAQLMKTIVPARAEANVSLRLVADQTVAGVHEALEQLVRDATPAGASVELELLAGTDPAHIPADSPAIRLARQAFTKAIGVEPLLVRTGGSLPVVSALSGRAIPVVLSGFDLPEGNIHAPNERFLVENLELGLRTTRELFVTYAGLR